MQPNASTSSSKLPSPLLTVTNTPQPIRMPGADFGLSLERSMQNPQRTSQQAERPSQTESGQNRNMRQAESENASSQKDQTDNNSKASQPSNSASKSADETPANREGQSDSDKAANAAGDETSQPANIAAVAHLVAGTLPTNLSLAKEADPATVTDAVSNTISDAVSNTISDAVSDTTSKGASEPPPPTDKLNNSKPIELGFAENADPKARTKANSALTMVSTTRTGTNAQVSNVANTTISTDGIQALQTAKADPSLSQVTLQTGASQPTTGIQQLFMARNETPTVMQVSTPAGQKVWSDDIANRVMWLAGRGEGRAELILTPPNLGKLGVTIQMNGDQATAHFVTASSSAREALENAMPRLREALQQAGIAMGDTSVSTSSQQQQSSDDGYRSTPTQSRAGDNEYGMLPELSSEHQNGRFVQVGTGLVDIFA